MAGLCSRGCGKPIRARGLCVTHYNQEHQPERHRKVTVSCGWCGKPCEKEPGRAERYAVLVCSLSCRDTHRAHLAGQLVCHLADRVVDVRRPNLITIPTAPKVKRPRWTAGVCRECAKPFVDVWLAEASATYCSKHCGKRSSKRARRARLAQVRHERYRPVDVYTRDGWRCHLCGTPVKRNAVVPHPRAPTIDHLVLIAAGGDDVLANVACAHFLCNSRKSYVGGAQLLLFGE